MKHVGFYTPAFHDHPTPKVVDILTSMGLDSARRPTAAGLLDEVSKRSIITVRRQAHLVKEMACSFLWDVTSKGRSFEVPVLSEKELDKEKLEALALHLGLWTSPPEGFVPLSAQGVQRKVPVKGVQEEEEEMGSKEKKCVSFHHDAAGIGSIRVAGTREKTDAGGVTVWYWRVNKVNPHIDISLGWMTRKEVEAKVGEMWPASAVEAPAAAPVEPPQTPPPAPAAPVEAATPSPPTDELEALRTQLKVLKCEMEKLGIKSLLISEEGVSYDREIVVVQKSSGSFKF